MDFIKGLARGICFLSLAVMIVIWNEDVSGWISFIVAFSMGSCAYLGWS